MGQGDREGESVGAPTLEFHQRQRVCVQKPGVNSFLVNEVSMFFLNYFVGSYLEIAAPDWQTGKKWFFRTQYSFTHSLSYPVIHSPASALAAVREPPPRPPRPLGAGR